MSLQDLVEEEVAEVAVVVVVVSFLVFVSSPFFDGGGERYVGILIKDSSLIVLGLPSYVGRIGERGVFPLLVVAGDSLSQIACGRCVIN